jgi:tRNA dimethylallyltransferase
MKHLTASPIIAQNWPEMQEKLRHFLQTSQKPLIVVLGPTASGKTAFSVELAHRLQGEGRSAEILNADSRQCYKYLNIGTAKITEEERRGVPHHLMDVLDPKEPITVAWYKDQAERVIESLHAQKKIPMLVGGSMLYISSVIDGLELLPKALEQTRQKLEEEWNADAGHTLKERLKSIDPESASSFPLENKVYVIRALEIYEETGIPASNQKRAGEQKYDLFIIGMNIESDLLKKRITLRLDAMLQNGWVEEVRSLMAKGYTQEDPGMESHGYREIMEMLQNELPLEEVRSQILSNTLAYAKRQRTWWRRDERIQWITPPGLADQA